MQCGRQAVGGENHCGTTTDKRVLPEIGACRYCWEALENMKAALTVFFVAIALTGCATEQTKLNVSQTPVLRLSFVVDKQFDVNGVVSMFRHSDPAGIESRARSMGVDLEVARRIHDTSSLIEARHLAERLVNSRFTEDGAAIRRSITAFQNPWEDLLPLFSAVVVETTQSPWIHSHYTCVVSSIHPGLSNWRGNKVAVKYDSSREVKLRILAHEIALSDVFQLFRERYTRFEVDDWQVWAFSEITAVFILDDPRLRAFWPDFPHAGGYFAHSNYKQLAEIEKRLKAVFDGRTSYIDYEDQAAGILRAFKQTR